MSNSSSVLAVFSMAAITCCAPGQLRAQVCPPSAIQVLWGNGEVQSSAAAFSQDYTPSGYPTIASGSYDLGAGNLALFRTVSGVSWTYVRAHDAYDVMGVAPGTLVSLVANLDLDGYLQSPGCGGSGCGGHLGGRIFQGATIVEDDVTFPNAFVGGQANLHTTLQLPVAIIAGTPTELEFELWELVPAGGNAGGAGTAHIHFGGLPSGARVISCQGFLESVTPTRRTSWGSLKSIYR